MIKNRKIISFCILTLIYSCSLLNVSDTKAQGGRPTVPAPERIRTYDVKHIKIEVGFDWEQKKVTGEVETTIKPLADNFREFEVDAVGFNIHSIQDEDDNDLKFKYDGKKIKINLEENYSPSDNIIYTVKYDCKPQRGLYFIYPTELNPSMPNQIWTQGEGEDHRHWFPVYDYPNDKTTFEIYATVDSKYKTLSNGHYEDSKLINDSKQRVDHWVMDKPNSTYLIMLAAGEFNVVHDKAGNLPVMSYVDRNINTDDAKYTFRNTPEMVKVFNDKFKYYYPWNKYTQVMVEDFIYGGMENTTATVLNKRLIYSPATENDYSSDHTIAHELGHQWWGDLVTCRNWSEMWLNESFAEYSTALWDENYKGKDEYDYFILRDGDNALRSDTVTGRYPIWAGYGSVTANLYDKGAVILNTFRNILGDEIFFASLGNFLKDNEYKNVVTQDLINAINKTYNGLNSNTGISVKDFKWMFDQWIWKAGYPEFEVSYEYDNNAKEVVLNVRQVQELDSLTPLFKTPIDIRLKNLSEDKVERIEISGENETYRIPSDSKPEMVVFDYGNNILDKSFFNKPFEDWRNQFTISADAVDRIMALRGLERFLKEDGSGTAGNQAVTSDNSAALKLFEDALTEDEYWGVRAEAAKILGKNLMSEKTSEVLKNSYEIQIDSRIKREILKALGNSDRSEDIEFIKIKIQNEPNDYITADGISALGKCLPKEEIYETVIPFVKKTSHRNVIQYAAVNALDSADSKVTDDRIKIALTEIAFGTDVEGRLRANAISALRPYAKDDAVKTFAVKYCNYNFTVVKRALISLLGNSGDKSIIPMLRTMQEETTDESMNTFLLSTIKKLEETN